MNPTRRAGMTLVEVIVTLAVLSITLGVTGLAVGALEAPPEADVPRRVAEARAQAVGTGRAVVVMFDSVTITLFPDGSATPGVVRDGDAWWRVDPWTAEVVRANSSPR